MLFLAVATTAAALLADPPLRSEPAGVWIAAISLGALVCATASAGLITLGRGQRPRPLSRRTRTIARAGAWFLAVSVVDAGVLLALTAGYESAAVAAALVGIGLLVAAVPRASEFDVFAR